MTFRMSCGFTRITIFSWIKARQFSKVKNYLNCWWLIQVARREAFEHEVIRLKLVCCLTALKLLLFYQNWNSIFEFSGAFSLVVLHKCKFTWLRAAHEIIFITYNVKKFNMQIHWPVKRNIFNRNECIFLPLNQHLPPTEIRTTTCTSFHGGVKLYGAFSSQEWF